MIHLFLIGILLGWGAAVPIGPVNLEITRRNLRFGTPHGIAMGVGASSADLTYLVLLSLGILILINHPDVLRIIGIGGGLMLGWFGINALRMKDAHAIGGDVSSSIWRNGIEGYFITLLNPYTIIFWASVGAQISVTTNGNQHGTLWLGAGLIAGVMSWIFFLNFLLHFTREKLSQRFISMLNKIGGVILLGFAVFGIWSGLR